MPFSPVPRESKNQINRAGQLLARGAVDDAEFTWAWDLASRWRASHAYPINTFQSTLRTRLREYPGEPIVAQRLKRMPTIIDKLRRYTAMQLTTMQDIGGLRAILGSVRQVRRLTTEYKKKGRFSHELIDEKDYIASPRDEDGYRSVHLIYRYGNPRNPHYDGLRLELQIRTRLQHAWATAVETMGTFLGQALKSRQGDQQWLDFFAVASSAFALKERTPPIPRFSCLSPTDSALALSQAEERIAALDKMKGFSVAVDHITKADLKRWSYHLIVLNSLERKVRITPYDRDSFEKAVEDYYLAEKQAAEGTMIEPVLVSAGPIATLRRAYPNFFLDIGEFVAAIEATLQPVRGAPQP